MKNTLTIAWKETKTYFASPMAYIIMAVYAGLAAYYFVTSISGILPEATVRGYLVPSTLIFALLSPVITMRLLAEEQKLGTLELLMTAPIRDYEIVLGKFLAALASLVSILVPTAYLVLMLFWFWNAGCRPHPQRLSGPGPLRHGHSVRGAFRLIPVGQPDTLCGGGDGHPAHPVDC